VIAACSALAAQNAVIFFVCFVYFVVHRIGILRFVGKSLGK
jgi:hypothetical protein